MDFTLGKELTRLKADIIAFSQANLNDSLCARNRERVFARDLWDLCGEHALQGLPVPTEYGGRGLDALSMAIALEGFGYGCEDSGLAFAVAAHLLSCVVPIWVHGSEEQKTRYLPELCSGRLVCTNAMTEPQGGSAAFDMVSEAQPLPDQSAGKWALKGVKSYCANAPIADLCVAYVLTDRDKGFFGGVSAFLLNREEHGFKVVGEVIKPGLKTCLTGIIDLEGVVVSEQDLIGRLGGGAMIFTQSMNWERIGIAGLHLGTMTRLLERAIRFARERKSGGVPLARHQAVSHRLADLDVGLEACRWLVYQAASVLGGDHNCNHEAARAKLFVSEQFKKMSTELMQLYAGVGFSADHEISRVLMEAMASTIYSGTSEIQKNIVAGSLGL
jgi:alkylation response protein AidB-like acyl-CoA dehydrogenase